MSKAAGSIGSVYADALAQAAEAKSLLAQAGEELAAFASIWRRDAKVRTFFLSGAIHRDAKKKALSAVTAGRASDLFADFLQVLLARQRLWLLPDIADAYVTMLDKKMGRVPVTLHTAAPVTAADLEGWRARLQTALGKEPVLRHEVRPALVGGAVLRVGDTVADGSVRRRLAELKRRLSAAGTR